MTGDLFQVRIPSPDTQCGKLLRAMRDGVRLTIWNAMVDYGCGALHQRMRELKKMGWPIKRDEVTRHGKTFAEFWLDAPRSQS